MSAKKKSRKKTDGKFVIGTLSVNARGFGFVKPEKEDSENDSDIFIPAQKMSSALNGDRVKVEITPPRNYYEQNISRKREGKIVRVLKRVNTTIVGTYRIEKEFHYVEPDDSRIQYKLFTKNEKDFPELKPGMKVVTEITNYCTPSKWDPMYGNIVEVLGTSRNPGIDILSIIRRYDVPEEFPQEVQAIAAQIETEPNQSEINNRVDRRNLKIVTIDGEDAKDLDDGVFARRNENGTYFLGIYIADVSYYVREQEPLDVEAYERGTSIYLVDRVIPMLPRELSNGICSLNAGVDRLAMACEMMLDSAGQVKSYKIFQTVIHVYKRLSYNSVNKFLLSDDSNIKSEYKEIASMLEDLRKICELRKNIRWKRGAIDFDVPEIKVILDENGKPIELQKRERNLAESIIEECMLAANETVAKHMFDKKLPFIYRVHEQPDSEKMMKFNELLATFGLHVNRHEDGSIRAHDIQRVLEQVKGRQEEKIINNIALRSMQQACYTAENSGHFGLAAEYYTHFTSPIRRYPDLIVHRLLRETFKGKILKTRINKLTRLLPKIAEQSSNRERRAVDIERETTDLKIVEYMKRYLYKKFTGIICSVTNFGFFVELENGAEGLVRAANISGDYFIYVESEYALVGKFTGKTFKIGEQVKVKLVEANVQLRQLTFELVGNFNKIPSEEIITDIADD